MYSEILILAHLARQAAHGYEIKKRVEHNTGGALAMNNNMLYPALRRFEEMGAVHREVVRQQGKPDRHIYSLTDHGIEILQHLLREFPAELAADSAEFVTRVAFFDLLEPEARLEILAMREQALQRMLDHYARVIEGTDDAERHPYMRHVLAFTEQQTRHELEWIAGLRGIAADE